MRVAAFTIDELARETGMTVRNVALPPRARAAPAARGPRPHRLLRPRARRAAAPDPGAPVRGPEARRASSACWAIPASACWRSSAPPAKPPEPPEVVTAQELGERIAARRRGRPAQAPGEGDQARRAASRWARVTSRFRVPALLSAAEEVVKRGVSLAHALDMIESVERHARAVAREFIKLFMDDVWKPFADAGMPAAQWGELTDSIEHVRPLAGHGAARRVPAHDGRGGRGDVRRDRAAPGRSAER